MFFEGSEAKGATKFDNSSRLLSSFLAPYLPHFEFVLSDLKSDGCVPTRALQKLLSIQEAKIQYFKFEILICF
jgi:hypothetical protein